MTTITRLESDWSKSTKMHSVEAARGIAASIVMLMHAANLMNVPHFYGHVGMGRVFDFGYIGVDFFFALSGFIITYVNYRDIGSFATIPRYLWRRFSRIYPIYWVILVLSILTLTFGRIAIGKTPQVDIGFADILGTIFLVMGEGEPKYLGVAWTLQFEVVFYFAFCVLLMSARIGAAVFTAWGAFVLAQAFGFCHLELPFNLGNAHCFEFLLGVAVGVVARRHRLRTTNTGFVCVLLCFVAAVLFEVYGPYGRHDPMGRIVLGFASAAVLGSLVGLERREAFSTPSWLVRIGSVSYSIYLGHILFISLTYMALLKTGLYHKLPESAVFVMAIASALIGTMLIGIYIELPLVSSLKDRWLGGAVMTPISDSEKGTDLSPCLMQKD